MKRFLRITLWTIAAVTVLLIAAAIVVVLVFDPNKYKPEIAAAVQKATGRELTIQGDLKLSLFPWLGVETGPMSLSNAPGFAKEAFAKIGGAAIKVKLLPLFKKDVEVDTVTLDGLYLHLMRGASGKTNWEDLTGKNGKETTTAPAAPSTSTAASTVSTFAIGGVKVRDATVIWDDQQNKAHYELSKLALHTGSISANVPVSLELDSDIKSNEPALSAHLSLSTQASYGFETQILRLKGLKLTVQARGKGLPADDVKLSLSSDAELKLADKHYQLNDLQLLATLQGNKLPGKQVDATVKGNVVVDLQKETLAVAPLSLAAWNLKLNGQILAEHLMESPRFTGNLTIADFNARELLGRLSSEPLNTADKQALGAVGASLSFNASATDAALTKLELKLDQTQITGTAAINNFAHPAYRFQLALDNIDADRYLPPPTQESAKAVTPAAAAGAGAAELPLDTLRALDVVGDIVIGKLKIAKLNVSDIKLGLNAKSGVIRVNPLAAHLYGGDYRGDTQIDARGKAVQVSVNEVLSNIELGPLTKDLLEKDLVAGTGNIHLKLSGTGLSPDTLKRTLNGTLGFSLQNGRVNGVNLIDLIQKDYLKYIQGLAIDAGKLNQTVFSKFSATATVSNGLIDTRDLALNSAQLNVKGRGTVNLVDEALALHLDAVPVGELAKQLGKYKDTVIPIRVEGTLSAPKIATDLDDMLKQKAKARLDKEKQKLEDEAKKKSDEERAKLEKKAQEQLKKQLKGLFK
jgi:AsmA protein